MDCFQECRQTFEAAADTERAQAMARYMRDRFAFYGIPTPTRRLITRDLSVRAARQLDLEALEELVQRFWAAPQREMQYFACDLLTRCRRRWTQSTLELCRLLVCSKSWWDTVDFLAGRIVGPLVEKFPDLKPSLDNWACDPNFWLRRVAILHQLHYGKKTDERRLFSYCLASCSDPEFFLRKAIGWALREYAKTEPERVYQFLQSHRSRLSPLSLREATKHLGERRQELLSSPL